jgi:hypothetical protein
MRGISCLALPIRDHAFFEQTVFQRQFRHNFLQGAGLTAQILHLVRGRCARRVAGEPLLPRIEEILRPAIIQVLDDSLAPAQFGDALLAAQAFSTMRIFSSAKNCRRVARRMSFTTFSAGSFTNPDFCLISLKRYDEPEILPSSIRRI